MDTRLPRCIVLVGLPGAGKSTVGALVAARLAWRFVDLDIEIARAAARSVVEIFAGEGEATFRRLEREATARVAAGGPLVLSPGGGWMSDPSNLAGLGRGVMSVYLRVSPAVALARLSADVAHRPLLAGEEPLKVLMELSHRREGSYLQANHTLATDSLTPDALAVSIVALASLPVGD